MDKYDNQNDLLRSIQDKLASFEDKLS